MSNNRKTEYVYCWITFHMPYHKCDRMNQHEIIAHFNRSPEMDPVDSIRAPGSLVVSIDHQWESAPNSQSIGIQHNESLISHQQPLTPVNNVQSHSLQSSPSDNVDSIRPTLNPPSSCSVVQVPYQQPEDVLKISIPERSSPNESNRNNYLNGYIIWPQKMSPKNRKENLILSYLDSDKHLYKQSEITGTDQHYFHGIIFHEDVI